MSGWCLRRWARTSRVKRRALGWCPGVNVKPVRLYNWVKEAGPSSSTPARAPGSVEELRAQLAAVNKENRELARANEILQSAASFFGAELDRQSKR